MPEPMNHQPSATPPSSPLRATDLDFTDPSLQLVRAVVQAADDRKGEAITILGVTEVSTLADYFVIITAFSRVQVRAIARAIEDQVETELHRTPRNPTSQSDSSWVLQDFGDVVVHIQMPDERDYYNLEAFWGHGARLQPEWFLELVSTAPRS